MSIYDEVDSNDLIFRYEDLITKYVSLAKELAPKLEKFGKYRAELQELTSEFIRRNIVIQDKQELVSEINDEISKRDIDNGT